MSNRRASLWRTLASVLTGALIASAALVGVAAPASAADPVAVSVTQAPRAGGDVTVTGSGFSTVAPGAYVGLRADGATTDAYTVWVAVGNTAGSIPGLGNTAPMGADGSFTVTVPVPAFADGAGYSIVTRKAHGAVDPTQTTSTPLVYQALPAVATTIGLAADANPVDQGVAVTFTATVAASAASSAPLNGTVNFKAGGATIGSASLSAGAASFTTSALATGTHGITAEFVPANVADYLGVVSSELALVVNAVPVETADTTTTTLTLDPAQRALLGSAITLNATVANVDGTDAPLGNVEFFSTAAGTTDRVSVGSASVTGGVATLTTSTLAAGGHAFTAVYTPSTADFVGSESAASANFGVVDTAAPAACVPGSTATTVAGNATATWGWSAYSAGWTKVATGDVTVVDGEFALSNGTVTADAACATISFTGTLRVEAYAGFFPPNGQWVELVNPVLALAADGSGVWTADVRTGIGAYAESATQRTVVAVVDATTGGTTGIDGPRTVEFEYAASTAPGTWSVAGGIARDGAWPNAFVLQVPAAVQSFYYDTAAAGNPNKPAADLSVDFDWPAVSTTALTVAPVTRALLGDAVSLTATVTPATAKGSVVFTATSLTGDTIALGSAEVVDGVATVTTTSLPAGGTTFNAAFTSTNGFNPSTGANTANYGIVDPATVAVTAPTSGERISGVTASWNWSDYAADWVKVASGNVAVGGNVFELTGGTGIVTKDAASIQFTGTLRVEAYANFFPPNGQWIELVDPVLTIADGVGTWSAGVRSGVGEYSATATTPLVVATVSGAKVPDFAAASVKAAVEFDYADTTAAGTWSARAGVGYTDSWSNEFVLAAPSAVKAFYYESGAAADGRKAPADLSLEWTAPTPALTVQNPSATVSQQGTLNVTGTGFRDGASVTLSIASEAPVVIGTQKADAAGNVTFAWPVPATFAAGAHTLTATVGGVAVATAPVTVKAVTVIDGGDKPEPEQPVCVARAVSGASLTWGVKQSFRDYIVGPIAKGAVSGGWGSGSGAYSTDTDRGRVSFGGTMTFTGHSGALDIAISNPRVQINSASSASLIVNVTSKALDGTVTTSNGIVFASLSLPTPSESANRISWSGAAATLTSAGAAAFAGFYEAGIAIDSVSFALPLGAEVECDSTTSGDLATTGGEAPFDGMWIGLGMLLVGAGGFALRRRLTAKA